MYNIGEIFYLDSDYPNKAHFCNENGLVINKIGHDDKGDVFQIQECPQFGTNEILIGLREMRQEDCFSVINRGILWYERLTTEQKEELKTWYQAWLDVTEETNKDENGNYIIPIKPSWLI